MVKILRLTALIMLLLSLSGCGQKHSSKPSVANPIGGAFGSPSDTDPLKLGKTPTLPDKNFKNPRPIKTPGKLPEFELPIKNSLTKNKPILGASPSLPDIFSNTSDFSVIMAPNGVVITVWATRPGNWLWGYSLYESEDLGAYRVWRLAILPNNEVMIINANTRTTCMNAYNNGVIHANCDVKNYAQKFTLRPMSNGAVQIYNKKSNMCLQTPIDDTAGLDVFGAINLTGCANTLDQQWYLVPPPFNAKLLY
ncbi:RICIN domain-containing protein [Campylobacter sp. 9BO]|uniref:RICIN domain-containing protein n=1 Tax=Campylobacter sp. 9BO TaxID=3424759 RepID=UPI003D35771E